MYSLFAALAAITITLHGCNHDDGKSVEGCGPGGQKKCGSYGSAGKCYCPDGYKYHVVKESFATTVAFCIKENSTYEEVIAKTKIAAPNVDASSTLGSGTAGKCQWCAGNEQSSPDSTANGACWTPAQSAKATCPQEYPFAAGDNNAWCAKSGYIGGVNEIFFRGLLNGQYWYCCLQSHWNTEDQYCSQPYDCQQGGYEWAGPFTSAYQFVISCPKAPCATYGLD